MNVLDFGIQLRWSPESKSSGSSIQSNNGSGVLTDSSESDREDGCAGSPRMQRRRKRRNKSRGRTSQTEKQSGPSSGDTDGDDLAYVDTLPEVNIKYYEYADLLLIDIFAARSSSGSYFKHMGD